MLQCFSFAQRVFTRGEARGNNFSLLTFVFFDQKYPVPHSPAATVTCDNINVHWLVMAIGDFPGTVSPIQSNPRPIHCYC